MDENVIVVKFGDSRFARTKPQWRYNRGQKLRFDDIELPAVYQVHFSNSKNGPAKTKIGNSDGVDIPQEYYLSGDTIYAWVFINTPEYGITKYEARIPVDQKGYPTDQEPDPDHSTVIDDAIDALNSAIENVEDDIETALQEAKDSGEFDGVSGTTIWTYLSDPIAPQYTFLKYLMRGTPGAVPKENDLVSYGDKLYIIIEVHQFDVLTVYYMDLRGRPGDDGIDGSLIWWTEHKINQITDTTGIVGRPQLRGSDARKAAQNDYVLAQDLGLSGTEINTLYIITTVASGCILTRLGSLSGPKGDDGVSPTVTVTEISGGHRVTITDADGDHVFDVMDGTGGGGSDDVYWVTPGVDSYADIVSLQAQNKLLAITYENRIYTLQFVEDEYAWFCSSASGKFYYLKCRARNSSWSASSATPYAKPSGGIPDTDLSASVQASLTKADSALSISGGTMTGAVDMGGNKISGLADGTADNDAVTLSQMSSAISQSSAYFRGSFSSKAALLAVAWQTLNPSGQNYVTNNDYAIVLDDETQNDECWRYLYVSGSGWTAQYRINETPLTNEQLAALNSGITSELVAQIGQGGTSNYNDLSNRPQIAGITLSGNKTLASLGIQPERFVITLRWNYEGEIYLYADKTYSEILAAVNAGVKDIVVHWIEADTSQMDAWCWFDCVSGGEIFFHAIEYGDGAKSIHFAYVNSQNVWGGGDNVLGTYSKPSGGIPGSDLAETYLTHHQSLTDYRTAAAQDVIDQQIAAAIPDVSGKADKVTELTVSDAGAVTRALDAGKAYHFTGALTALTLTLNAPAGGQRAQYHFDFATGSTAPTVTIPGTVTMPTGWAVEANKRYEIDILDGYGVVSEWTNS